MPNEYELDLATRCASGDRLAEKELYLTYAARLYALCIRYASDREEAQDLVHDVMIKAFGVISKYRYTGEGSLYAWLRRLTINMAVDRLRKKRFRIVPIWDFDLPEDDDGQDLQDIPPDVLLGMVAGLPRRKRLVFNMFCIDGMSHKEISELLGISEKGSASLLAKARMELKKDIADYLKRIG